MNDPALFAHGQEGTHSACDARLKAEGGKAQCCTCVPHDACAEVKDEAQARFEAEAARLLNVYWGVSGHNKNEKLPFYVGSIRTAAEAYAAERVREGEIATYRWMQALIKQRRNTITLVGIENILDHQIAQLTKVNPDRE